MLSRHIEHPCIVVWEGFLPRTCATSRIAPGTQLVLSLLFSLFIAIATKMPLECLVQKQISFTFIARRNFATCHAIPILFLDFRTTMTSTVIKGNRYATYHVFNEVLFFTSMDLFFFFSNIMIRCGKKQTDNMFRSMTIIR